MAELFPFADDAWDRQMKIDAAAGKFARLDREVRVAEQSGTSLPLERILAEDP